MSDDASVCGFCGDEAVHLDRVPVGLTEVGLCADCLMAYIVRLVSTSTAAREEGRREGEADDLLSIGANMVTWVSNAVEGADHWHDEFLEWYKPEQWLGGHRAASAFIAGKVRALHAAHAAQLVALRDIVDCACNALTDSVRASGNDARTNMHWVDMLRRKALAPLPDAEAALKRVREEAVRDMLEQCAPALSRLKTLERALDRGGEAAWAAEAHAIYCELSNAIAARQEET